MICRARTRFWPKVEKVEDWVHINEFRRRFHRYQVRVPEYKVPVAQTWCERNIGPRTIYYDHAQRFSYWTNGRWDWLWNVGNKADDPGYEFMFRREVEATAFKLVWY
ncbi:MAG: hypothetical protein EOO77_21335 [Oxalobacteraceae bacterium]|nr:MAG: hypothetical protein EOO77_21335 [Oxalobacteraceae bacterium]